MHMFAIIFLKKGYKIKIIYGNLEGRKVWIRNEGLKVETVTIRVSDAEPGMVTAEDIHSNSMMLLVAQNTSLTERKMARLKFYGILEFKVYQEEQNQEQDTENLGIVANKPQNIIQ